MWKMFHSAWQLKYSPADTYRRETFRVQHLREEVYTSIKLKCSHEGEFVFTLDCHLLITLNSIFQGSWRERVQMCDRKLQQILQPRGVPKEAHDEAYRGESERRKQSRCARMIRGSLSY